MVSLFAPLGYSARVVAEGIEPVSPVYKTSTLTILLCYNKPNLVHKLVRQLVRLLVQELVRLKACHAEKSSNYKRLRWFKSWFAFWFAGSSSFILSAGLFLVRICNCISFGECLGLAFRQLNLPLNRTHS